MGFVATLVYLGRHANALESLSAQQEGLTKQELLVKERENGAKKVQHVERQLSKALQQLQAFEAERSRLEALNEGVLQENVVLRSRSSVAADDMSQPRAELRLSQEFREIARGLVSGLARNKLRVQARSGRNYQTSLKAMNVKKHRQAMQTSPLPTNAFRQTRSGESRASTGVDFEAMLVSKNQTKQKLQQNNANSVKELQSANVELKSEVRNISDQHDGMQRRLDDKTVAVADRDQTIQVLRKASEDAYEMAKRESSASQGLENELKKVKIELQKSRYIQVRCGNEIQNLMSTNAQIQNESADLQAQVSRWSVEKKDALDFIENQREKIQTLENSLQAAGQEAIMRDAAGNENAAMLLRQNLEVLRQTQEIGDLQRALQQIKEADGPRQRDMEGRLRHKIRLEVEPAVLSRMEAQYSHKIRQINRILEEQQAELTNLKAARRDSSNKSRAELEAREARLKEQQSNLELRETNVKVRERATAKVGPAVGEQGCDHAKRICVHDNAVLERKIDGMNRELANQKSAAQKASGTLRSLTKKCDESEREASKLRQERNDLQTRQRGMDNLGASHQSRFATQDRRIKELEGKNAELQQRLDCGQEKAQKSTAPVDDVHQLTRGVANLATTQPDSEVAIEDESEESDSANDSAAARQRAMHLKAARMGKQPVRVELAKQMAEPEPEPEKSPDNDGDDEEEVAKAVQASLQVDDEAEKDEDKPCSSKASTASRQPSSLSASSVEPAQSQGSDGAATQTTPPSNLERDTSRDSLLMPPPPIPSAPRLADNRNLYGKRSRGDGEEGKPSKSTKEDGREKEASMDTVDDGKVKQKEKGKEGGKRGERPIKKVKWGISRTELELPKKL